jgi:hypothetical protein
MSAPILAVIALVVLANVAAVAVAVVRARRASDRMRDALDVRLDRYAGPYAAEQGEQPDGFGDLP